MKMTFCRAVCLAAAFLLMGCDEAPETTTASPAAQVLEGKTMGTLWRVSVVGIDAKRAAELQTKIQTQLDADDWLLSTYKNDSALMRFNHSRSLAPWPVSEAMADIVTSALRIGAKTDGAMDITVGPLVNLWGFGPDRSRCISQHQHKSMRQKRKQACNICRLSTGLDISFCKKICRIFMLISPRSGRAMRRITWRV